VFDVGDSRAHCHGPGGESETARLRRRHPKAYRRHSAPQSRGRGSRRPHDRTAREWEEGRGEIILSVPEQFAHGQQVEDIELESDQGAMIPSVGDRYLSPDFAMNITFRKFQFEDDIVGVSSG
jgi:hypothetical protein